MEKKFSFVMPAQISKSEDGQWRIAGLASTESKDRQEEIVVQKGIDLSAIEKGKGWINFEHKSGPENLIGTLDGYHRDSKGLWVQGTLFKNHDRAKSIKQIMDSLGETAAGRIGMSVEGSVIERDSSNPKIIKKCSIDKVALTFNPVNTDTYAQLIKSLSAEANVEFDSTEDKFVGQTGSEKPVFTATELVDIVSKALGTTGAYATTAPADLSGGDALSQSNISTSKKRKKSKKVDPTVDLYKSKIDGILDRLQRLYPEYSRNLLFSSFKERLNTRYPEITEIPESK